MRGEHILDLDRIDILAARDEHLLPAAGDVGEAIGVAAGKVARAEPAVGGESRTRRLIVVPVTRRDDGAREEQVATIPSGTSHTSSSPKRAEQRSCGLPTEHI